VLVVSGLLRRKIGLQRRPDQAQNGQGAGQSLEAMRA